VEEKILCRSNQEETDQFFAQIALENKENNEELKLFFFFFLQFKFPLKTSME